ncbi:hypothetical protein PG994_008397 [Apiospora phragmitis]|uniref:Heterokaryon incompatibility domain-containing protein n=1 Tax=Apiospora phragmitis TaxID=2905665 RepID=A0ABR1UVD0_9PEZI
MSNFAYEPLTAPDAFRLLVLEPGVEEDALRCRLFHTTHSSRPDYEALSYTWGSPHQNEDEPAPACLINGNTVPIRRNLQDALRHLWWRDYERVLWIDQSNVRERNHQVGRMRDIYRNAETVRVWLGRASETSPVAMRWIDESASRHRSRFGVPGCLADYASPEDVRRSQTRRWRALLSLLERPYWRRVWIVQEIVLAKNLRLQCGGDESRWEGLVHLLDGQGRDERVFQPRAAKATIRLVRSGLPAQWRKQPIIVEPAADLTSCVKTKTPESFENEGFRSEIQDSFGFWTGKAIAWLTVLNVTAFIASNGQMGLVPEGSALQACALGMSSASSETPT